MALSKAEIELLIKARNEAQGTFDALSTQINQVTGAATAANKALGDTGEAAKKTGSAVDDGTKKVKIHKESLQDFVAGYIGARLTYDAFLGTFKAGVAFIKDSVNIYAEHEAVVSHLTAVLNNQRNPLKGNLEGYRELAKQISETTQFTEDETTAAIANFVALGDLGPNQMEKAIQASSKLATVMGTDLGTAAQLLNKYLEGNATALKRAGIEVSALTPLEKGASAALDELNLKLGDVDTQANNTTKGGLKNLEKGFEDFEQRAGAFISGPASKIGAVVGGIYTAADKSIAGVFQGLAQFGVSTSDFITGAEKATVAYDAEGRILFQVGSAAHKAAEGLRDTTKAEDDHLIKGRIAKQIDDQLAASLDSVRVSGEVLVQTLAKLQTGGASQQTIFQILGGDADQAYKQMKVLEAEGVQIPAEFRKNLAAAADAVRSAGLADAISKVADETRSVQAQSAQLGLASRIAGLASERDAAIKSAAEQNQDVTAAKQLEAAIRKNYNAKIAAEQLASSRQLQTELTNIEFEGQKGIVAAQLEGSQAKLAIIDIEEKQAIAVLLQTESSAAVIAKRRTNIEKEEAAKREAVILDEQKATVNAVIAAEAEIEQSRIAAENRGMALKIKSLDAQERAEVASLERQGLAGDNFLAQRAEIERRYDQKRNEARVLAEREVQDELFSIEQDIMGERIALGKQGVDAALASNELELQAKLRTIKLEKDGDDRLVKETIQLYHERAQRIIAENEPVYQAWLKLGADVRQSWADALDGALHKTQSWKSAILAPFKQLGEDILKIFTSTLASIEGAFLNPLRKKIMGMLGSSLKGVPGFGSTAGESVIGGLETEGTVNIAGGAAGAGAGGAGAAGAGTGILGSALAGGLGTAAAGFGIGALLQKYFGKTAGAIGGAAGGAGAGALLGTFVLPGIGTALGAGIGALAGAAGGLLNFGPSKKEKAGRQAVSDFEGQFQLSDSQLQEAKNGGANAEQWRKDVIAVRDAYLATGRSEAEAEKDVKAFWASSKGGPEAVAKAMIPIAAAIKEQEQLNAVLAKYGVQWQDLSDSGKRDAGLLKAYQALEVEQKLLIKGGLDEDGVLKKQAASYNDLIVQAMKSGTQIPQGMQPIIKKLQEMGLLTQDAKDALLGLTKAATVDFKSLEGVAKGYGIELKDLGSKFQQAHVSGEADQIYKDFKALEEAGADVNGVLRGMSDEISTVVQESIKFGVEVPANLQPLVTKLIESGQLLDENGQKITDIKLIKFAAPVEDQTDKLIKAIDHLADAFLGLPDAARRGAEGAADAFNNADFTVHPRIDWPTNGSYGDPNDPNQPQVEGGAAKGVLANRPGLVLFGEGGETEVGGPKSFFKQVFDSLGLGEGKVGASRDAGGNVHLTFNVTALDTAGFQDAVHKKILPVIVKAVGGNVQQSRTNLRAALGTT